GPDPRRRPHRPRPPLARRESPAPPPARPGDLSSPPPAGGAPSPTRARARAPRGAPRSAPPPARVELDPVEADAVERALHLGLVARHHQRELRAIAVLAGALVGLLQRHRGDSLGPALVPVQRAIVDRDLCEALRHERDALEP